MHPTISKIEPGQTNGAWIKRRVMGQRTANRTGPESWKNSRGTECKFWRGVAGRVGRVSRAVADDVFLLGLQTTLTAIKRGAGGYRV